MAQAVVKALKNAAGGDKHQGHAAPARLPNTASENTVHIPPYAAALVESMRDIGYTLQTALADIIDNSISAGSNRIDLVLDVLSEAPALAIIDDGKSMSKEQLLAAMRPGSRSPREERDNDDLGRFGLGLKTASFSQCRRLTVVCRRGGRTNAARWDLDFVEAKNDWLVQVPSESD